MPLVEMQMVQQDRGAPVRLRHSGLPEKGPLLSPGDE
jgi:hypothetical protein